MSNLEIAEKIIKDKIMYGRCGIFNTKNTVNDPMVNLYNKDGLKVDICYYWEYFEVFGLTSEEFNELLKYYEELNFL